MFFSPSFSLFKYVIFFLTISLLNFQHAYSCDFGFTGKMKKKSNAEIANFLQFRLCSMNDAIPNPKPSEIKWVQEELKTKNHSRWMALVQSDEYNLYFGKKITNELCETSTQLSILEKDINKQSVTDNFKTKIAEMKWLKIAEKLTNNSYHNNLEHILERDITDYTSKSNIRIARKLCILVGNHILNILINKKKIM